MTPLIAQAAERWPVGDAVRAAKDISDDRGALAALRSDLAACQQSAPGADQCLDVLLELSATARRALEFSAAEGYARAAGMLAERTLPLGHRDIATTFDMLGMILTETGRHREGEAAYRRALAIIEAGSSSSDRDRVRILRNLAFNIDEQDRYAEAETLYLRAIELGSREPADPVDLAQSYYALAISLSRQSRYEAAELLQGKALTLFQGTMPAGDPTISASIANLGENLNQQGRYAEAEPILRRAIQMAETMLFPHDPIIAERYSMLARALAPQGKYKEAEDRLRFALTIVEAAFPADHPRVVGVTVDLANVLVRVKRWDEAASLYRQAIRTYEANRGSPTSLAASYAGMATLLESRGCLSEAAGLRRKAVAIFDQTVPPSHPWRINARWHLAETLRRQSAGSAELPRLYRAAADGVRARMAGFVGFSRAAQTEMRQFSVIFASQVKAAWSVGQGTGKALTAPTQCSLPPPPQP
ncbi:tetratricopeptide repeat protein [Sphingomonas tagetis]|uniref:tetratricopeptide repeat protein n=1 Tax=Sphingomonas tagetis TaxID=2949092 RepID=UPI0020B70EE8